MTTSAPATRPMLGALATGCALGAFAALAWPEICPPRASQPVAPWILIASWLASLALGALLAGRTGQPMARLARALGLAGLTMPLAVLAMRGAHVPALAAGSQAWLSLAAGWPTGALLGLAAAAALEAAAAHPRWSGRPRAVPAALVGAALAGVLFVRLVAGPKLAPLNAALDLTLGCAALGIVCTAGTPNASRRLETWLSLLAVAAILCLPLSGVLDATSRHWAEPAPPAASTPTPPAAAS